jgi:hypothetical protein
MECWERYANEEMCECFGSSDRNMTDNDHTQARPTMRDLGLQYLGRRHPCQEDKPTPMGSGWK